VLLAVRGTVISGMAVTPRKSLPHAAGFERLSNCSARTGERDGPVVHRAGGIMVGKRETPKVFKTHIEGSAGESVQAACSEGRRAGREIRVRAETRDKPTDNPGGTQQVIQMLIGPS
jgi:hypothetical protein